MAPRVRGWPPSAAGVELPGAAQLRIPGVQTLRAPRLSIAALDGRAELAHVNGDVVDCTPLDVEPWGLVHLLAPALTVAAWLLR